MKTNVAIYPGAETQGLRATPLNSKLQAALDYLGDKLATHRASRFKPAKHPLLGQWLAARRTLPAGATR